MEELCIFGVVDTEFEMLFGGLSRFRGLSEGDTELLIWPKVWVCQRNELSGNISPAILKCIVNQMT